MADDRDGRGAIRDDGLLVFGLNEGRAAKDRAGPELAVDRRGAWGADILRERSFLYLVASRFFILGGSACLIVLQVPYLERALGMTDRDQRALWILGTTAWLGLHGRGDAGRATLTAGRAQEGDLHGCRDRRAGHDDRRARRRPARPVVRRDPRGHGRGSFLAVDWALLTDIIPKASAGRYMGIVNIATATNAVAAAFVGGLVIDAASRFGTPELGPRVAFLLAPVWLAIGVTAAETGRGAAARGGRTPSHGSAVGVGRRVTNHRCDTWVEAARRRDADGQAPTRSADRASSPPLEAGDYVLGRLSGRPASPT